MKTKYKLLLKQGLKYLTIFLVAFLGMAIYRIMWAIPDNAFFWSVGVVVLIVIAMTVFDLMSSKDILPIFNK